jgi:pimeloyl-ACP methyl ester carboxylesterase
MAVLEVPSGKLRFQLTGRGAPVLWIQGVGVAGSGWQPQVEALSSRFNCLSFDNRGIGESTSAEAGLTMEQMADDARRLMDFVGWQSAHVVGHSMGGLIAQQLALGHPARIRSLSLLCTFSRGPEAARLTPWVLWMSLRTRLGSRAMRRRAFLEMLFPVAYLQGQQCEELAERLAPTIGRDLADQPPVLVRQLNAMRRYNQAASLGRLSSIPTLIASGSLDPIARPEYGRRLQAQIPNSRYVELPGLSHGMTLQSPELINPLLSSHFLAADAVGQGVPTGDHHA